MRATAPAEALDLEVMRDAFTSVRRRPPSSRSQSSAPSRREEREQPAGRGLPRAAVTAGAGADIVMLSARRIARRNLPEAAGPYLRMSGRWLEEYGFGIGSVVRVRVEHGRLTLISEAAEP